LDNKYISYILLIKNKEDKRIKIGKTLTQKFKKGFYVYIGSAKVNLISRIKRHLSSYKKLFWHIDYFLKSDKVEIKNVWLSSLEECEVANIFAKKGEPIKKFGSSDCRCISHLFYHLKERKIKDFLNKNFKRIKLNDLLLRTRSL
jgi:Uri superfamily endonuclease